MAIVLTFNLLLYFINSLTTSPARIKPTAEGTKEMLPGINRLPSVISAFWVTLIGGSFEYTTFKLSIFLF